MITEKVLSKCIELIKSGRTKQSLNLFSTLNGVPFDEVTLLISRIALLDRNNSIGQITSDEYHIELNKINRAFINMVSEFKSIHQKDSHYQTNDSQVFHPPETIEDRSLLIPAGLRILNSYKFDKLERWKSLGDIEVDIENSILTKDEKVYLIPSGKTVFALRDSKFLRATDELLKMKKRFGELFVENHKYKRLEGYVFFYNNYPMVYCSEYDDFLTEMYINEK